MTKEKMVPKMRKKIPKSTNKALHIEKKAPIMGGKPSWIFFTGGARSTPPPPTLVGAYDQK